MYLEQWTSDMSTESDNLLYLAPCEAVSCEVDLIWLAADYEGRSIGVGGWENDKTNILRNLRNGESICFWNSRWALGTDGSHSCRWKICRNALMTVERLCSK